MRILRELKQPLKTALAAALALLAYQGLHLQHGYWAVISAIIVMQANLGRSMTAGANRLAGTAVGAVLGTVVFRVFGSNFAGLFVAVALTIWVCSITGLRQSSRLAGVTASIVMLIGEGSAWQAGINRFVDVALGILIALAVSLAWPSRARHDLRNSLAQAHADLLDLFNAVLGCLTGECDSRAIDASKTRAKEHSHRTQLLLADVAREPGEGEGQLLTALQHSAERIREHIFGMDYSARMMQHDSFHRTLAGPLQNLRTDIRRAFARIAADLRDIPPPQVPAIEPALQSLESALASVREAGATLAYSSDELLRFYALFYRLQQLVAELGRSMEFANALHHSA